MIKTILTATFFTIGIAQLSRADILPVLSSSSLSGAPGSTLDFFVTLTNTSATDQVWLNGIGSTSSSAFLSIDTSPFFLNAPLFLDPSTSSGPFELFDVTIDPAAPADGFPGNFVSLLGGADGGAGTAFADLADVPFDVVVPSTVPEPASFGLVLSILMAMLWRLHRRRA